MSLHPKTAPEGGRLHVPAIDGLRGASALLVVAYHCGIALPSILHVPPDPPKLILGGGLAVPFFFVISGFVLYLPAAHRGGSLGSLRRYAARRIARIVPPYWAMLALLFLIWPFAFEVESPLASKDGVVALGVHLGFLQSLLMGPARYGFTYDQGFGVNPAVWSLTNEVLFYVALPFVSTWFFRRPRIVLGAALAVSVAWRLTCRNLAVVFEAVGAEAPPGWLGGHLFHQVPAYAWSFAVGMFAADALAKAGGKPAFSRRSSTLLHVGCVAALVVSVYLGGLYNDPGPYYDYPRDLIPAAVLALLIVVTTQLSPRGLWPYDNRVSRFLGDVSYGVFLFHMIVLQLAWRLLKLPSFGVETGSLLLYAVVIPVSVLVAFASHQLLELPILRFVRTQQRREPSASHVE